MKKESDKKVKLGVVVFNLGAPESQKKVFPFLFNLFFDPAILRFSVVPRFFLALFISSLRTKTAKQNYQILGGKSPLLDNTKKQIEALEKMLAKNIAKDAEIDEVKVSIAMRYQPPRAKDAFKELKDWGANRIVLLPFYPQSSTTTTISSIDEWKKITKRYNFNHPTSTLCCWPLLGGWLQSSAQMIQQQIDKIKTDDYKVLFCAHGIPAELVETNSANAVGDPYEYQINANAKAIAKLLDLKKEQWQVCFQSRVGRKRWLGPYVDNVLTELATEKTVGNVVIYPISFVSEHSETLVELDVEYKELVHKIDKNFGYHRASTVSCNSDFISDLSALVIASAKGDAKTFTRFCPNNFHGCFRAHKLTEKIL